MPGQLQRCRTEFLKRIQEAEDFVNAATAARHATKNTKAFKATTNEWIYELATLKLVIASEQFFETTLALYVKGAKAPNGYKPKRLIVLRSSLKSITNIFKGDQAFIGWNNTEILIKRAGKWLDQGEPFATTLSGTSHILGYLRLMRNVIAHESNEATEKYEKETRKLYGALTPRVTPGAQLTQPPPAAIPYLVGPNLFSASVATYRVIANRLVP